MRGRAQRVADPSDTDHPNEGPRVAIDDVVTTSEGNQGVTTESQVEHPEVTGSEAAVPGTIETKGGQKSIVPARYAGKYSGGGSDDLANFINAQAKGDDGKFSFDRFFDLCRRNGVEGSKVDHYQGQVNEKRHGAPGRARMTLRNMLATVARKNGSLTGLDGSNVPISLPKASKPGTPAA